MKILGFNINRAAPPIQQRRFNASRINRLTNDWAFAQIKINQDIKSSLATLRERSRDLAKNNNHFKKFLSMCEKHVIGPAGIQLQMKVEDSPGKPDNIANSLIENEFYLWGKKGQCDVSGKLSWMDCQKLFTRTFFCDGECVVRMIDGWDKNPWRFAIQFIDSSLLDVTHSTKAEAGNRIIMGVELDSWERPVKYWFSTIDNVDDGHGMTISSRKMPIPAQDIIHGFISEFVGQARGIPRGSSAVLAINMLNGYAEAELVAARAAACKGGFYTQNGGEYKGDDVIDGRIVEELSPGIARVLPEGVDFKEHNPTHPNGNYANYTKAILREIASGLDVHYNSLANDLEGVNYSSMRSGSLEERDAWKIYQQFTIETFCEPIFTRWLKSSIKYKLFNQLPMSKFDKFHSDTWIPRRWTWVDPSADVEANLDLLEKNLTTPQAILAEYGKDLEDVYSEMQKAKDLATKYGIKDVVKEAIRPVVDNIPKQ